MNWRRGLKPAFRIPNSAFQTMFSLPRHELLQQQSEWLSEARARILRLAEIGRRRKVLDLGCGYGATLNEMKERSGGLVVAMDLKFDPLHELHNAVNANALHAPFANGSFDLIFSQNFFLWVQQYESAIKEVFRLLQPGGVLVCIEPDYGGFIESPPEIESQSLWINGLIRAGAEPLIGRKLPSMLSNQLWNVRIDLLPRLYPPSPDRFKFLQDLPLTPDEQSALVQIRKNVEKIPVEQQLVHLPYFLVLAEKRG